MMLPSQRLKPTGAAGIRWEQFDQRRFLSGHLTLCAGARIARNLNAIC